MTVNINGTSGISGVDGSAGTPALQGSDSNTGISFGADEVNINTGGSTRATVDSSGRLLVGTATSRGNFLNTTGLDPRVQIEGTDGLGSIYSAIGNFNGAGGEAQLFLSKSRGTAVGSNTLVQDGDVIGAINFQGNDGSEFVQAAAIYAFVDGTAGANDMPGRLTFSTTADGASSATERMRIQADGNIGIGTSGHTTIKLGVLGVDTSNTKYAFNLWNGVGTQLFAARNDGALFTGVAAASPYNLTTGSGANLHVASSGVLYRSTSSIRFKTDIEPLEDSYADAILNIEPVWYRSTAPGDEVHPDWSYYGFIAEDVAQVDPRLVFWKTHEPGQDEDGNPTSTLLDEPVAEGVQYDRFVPHLLNLIKRQKEQLETQAATIAALDARLTALEGGTNP